MISTYVDSFFEIGSTHKICQDYAMHGFLNDKPYAIISDGCSSAPDTDFGSRILSVSLLKNIYNNDYNIKSLLNYTINFANISCKSLNLDDRSLFATLSFIKDEDSKYKVYTVGDSTIVVNYKDVIKIITYEFESGAPYYLAYDLTNKKQQYLDEFGNKVTKREFSIVKDGCLYAEKSYKEERFDFFEIFFEDYFEKKDIESIVICSDGSRSFRKTNISKTTKTDVECSMAEGLLFYVNYRNYVGEFVQRRANKAKKELSDKSIFHYDDLSIAGISIINEG